MGNIGSIHETLSPEGGHMSGLQSGRALFLNGERVLITGYFKVRFNSSFRARQEIRLDTQVKSTW